MLRQYSNTRDKHRLPDTLGYVSNDVVHQTISHVAVRRLTLDLNMRRSDRDLLVIGPKPCPIRVEIAEAARVASRVWAASHVGYNRSNTSPMLKLFLSRLDDLMSPSKKD